MRLFVNFVYLCLAIIVSMVLLVVIAGIGVLIKGMFMFIGLLIPYSWLVILVVVSLWYLSCLVNMLQGGK